jgi:hypothetical protein
MPRYIVVTKEVFEQPYEVEANSEEEALEKVIDGEGDILDDCFEYSHTLDRDTWTVELVEEDKKFEEKVKNGVLKLLA